MKVDYDVKPLLPDLSLSLAYIYDVADVSSLRRVTEELLDCLFL